jgi:glutathionylspermidine synthase
MSLDFFKWDSQVGDTATLFPQPLLIGSETWNYLKQTAQDLAAELREAENELVRRPELLTRLGLPNTLQAEFERQSYVPANTPTVRVLRFDFHYTTKGWRTSEVNSDVPGGYTEASRFTEMMAQRLQNVRAAGDPGRELAAAVLATVGEKASVALLSAPGFLEDQQVTAFLATELQLRTIRTLLVHDPSQLRWKDGVAFTAGNGKEIELDAIVRFYQGEWLAKLSDRCGWKSLFFGTRTLVANPAIAVLSESKRFPLIWPTLATKMSMWKLVMPQCRDPLEGDWNTCDEWVVKAAYSNTGDEVHVRDLSDARTWSGVRKAVEKDPRHWVMQRRFETVPINSDIGLLYPCIGVYTINGRACGIYGRASLQPITNYAAHDVAVLITEH